MADGSVHYLTPECLSAEDLQNILRVGNFSDGIVGPRINVYDYDYRLNWPNIASLAVWLLSVGVLLTVAARGRKARRRPSLTTSGGT